MSWTPLDPIVRTVPKAKASISVTKMGAKLTITLSETFRKELGNPEKCDVQGGAGENAGKVRLAFNAKGKFEIKDIAYGGARITAPVFSGIPDGAREAEACTIDLADKTQVIIALPLKAWEAQLQQPPKPESKPAAAPAAPPPTPPKTNGQHSRGAPKRLNMEVYLDGKGHDVERRADGQFVIDQQTVSKSKALTIVNEYRKKNSLPALGIDEVE